MWNILTRWRKSTSPDNSFGVASHSKRSCWRSESEVRFVILSQANNFSGLTETHTDARRYITYSLPLREPGNVAEIMVGQSAPSNAEQWVRDLLRDLDYPEGNAVIMSYCRNLVAQIPARPQQRRRVAL
jgi:hypothetical protein